METFTAREVADEFRCSARKVTEVARDHSIGADFQGRAGYRFTEADKLALWEAMRPVKPVEVRRRRRSA